MFSFYDLSIHFFRWRRAKSRLYCFFMKKKKRSNSLLIYYFVYTKYFNKNSIQLVAKDWLSRIFCIVRDLWVEGFVSVVSLALKTS